jgi:hypothetical protein
MGSAPRLMVLRSVKHHEPTPCCVLGTHRSRCAMSPALDPDDDDAVMTYARELVADWPPLTPAQQEVIRVTFATQPATPPTGDLPR